MTTETAVGYEVEIDKIESGYSGAVTIGATEADYQKRRDEARAGVNWNDDKPDAQLARILVLREEPRRFSMTLTKEEARGYGIGARVRVTLELVK